jgi:hypothetical protein
MTERGVPKFTGYPERIKRQLLEYVRTPAVVERPAERRQMCNIKGAIKSGISTRPRTSQMLYFF